jgi:general secretion pathway protein K
MLITLSGCQMHRADCYDLAAASTRATRGNRSADGFVLFVVLWFLVLLGTLCLWIMGASRGQIAQAHDVLAAARAEALADGGVAEAIMHLSDPSVEKRWLPDSKPHALSLRDGSMIIRITDEAGKVNPNLASDVLLTALFEVCGIDAGKAAHLGAAIADWVDADDNPRPFGAEAAAYSAAGKGYGPHNGAINSLDELYLVLGAGADSIERVKPFLSIFAPDGVPDSPYHIPTPVVRAMTLARNQGDGQTSDSADAGGDTTEGQPNSGNASGSTAQQALVVSIRVEAHSSDGGVYVRDAVVSTQPQGLKPYTVLDWQRGDLVTNSKCGADQ